MQTVWGYGHEGSEIFVADSEIDARAKATQHDALVWSYVIDETGHGSSWEVTPDSEPSNEVD